MKKQLSITFFLLMLVYTSAWTNAQETKKTSEPQVFPPSPESQIFERYINHEIEESSGMPVIEIPLYDIKIKGMTIPITLSYDASGIKYDQFDGTIGVGWSIKSMGFRAFREIHGRADDIYPFYKEKEFSDALRFHEIATHGYYFLSFIPSDEHKKIFPQGRYELQDSEYDIFSYLLPSSSGKFIITDRNSLKTASIENNRDDITLNRGYTYPFTNQIEQMNITDENGFKYNLGGKNMNSFVQIPDKTIYNGWPVTEIISPYGETIKFEYDVRLGTFTNRVGGAIGYEISDATETIVGPRSMNSFYNIEPIIDDSNGRKEFYIKKIKTPTSIIEFNYSVAHSDNVLCLKEIIIKDNEYNERKRITFNYEWGRWHRILASIEEGNGQEKYKKYNFDYYLPDVDYITKVTPDQWNYYSQAHSKDRQDFPLALPAKLENYKYLRTTKPKDRREIGHLLSSNEVFFDRSMNYGLLHSFSLKKITFPTGGFTEYEYEPHKFLRQDGVTVTAGGQRIKKILSRSEINTSPVLTEFKYGENENGIGIANFPWFDESHFVKESYIYRTDMFGTYTVVDYTQSRSYMTNPIMAEFSNFNVSYNKISTYKIDVQNSIMTKVTSRYDIPEQYKYDGLTTIANAYPANESIGGHDHIKQGNFVEVYDYSLGLKPLLRERIYYNSKLELSRKEEYHYNSTNMETYNGYKVRQSVFYGPEYRIEEKNPYWIPFTYVEQLCNYTPYYIKTGVNNLLLSKKTTDYANGQPIVTEEKYTYDDRYQVKTKSQYDSKGLERKEEYKYPYNFGTAIHKSMTNSNMISPVIENVVTYNNKQIFAEKTHYDYFKNLILPSKIETSTQGTNSYQAEVTFTEYDKRGNVVEYMTRDGLYTVVLWGYNYQYPIIKIENWRYNNIYGYYSFAELFDKIAAESNPDDGQWDSVFEFLSVLPTTAHATLYTYEPLRGVSSITAPSGKSSYFYYDLFGRLSKTWSNGAITEEYNYNYSNK